MLSDLKDFITAIDPFMEGYCSTPVVHGPYSQPVEAGQLYCGGCQGARRVRITAVKPEGVVMEEWLKYKYKQVSQGSPKVLPRSRSVNDQPSLFSIECMQCTGKFAAVIYAGHDGPKLVILPSMPGGLATANTPPNVAYYLDQAYRAQIGGAHTASVVMYRAALEQMLADKGYSTPNLANKIKALEVDIAGGTAERWALDLNPEFLKVIKDLGNEGIHVNSGDVSTLAAIDDNLVAQVQIVLHDILNTIYEKPEQRKQALAALQSARNLARP